MEKLGQEGRLSFGEDDEHFRVTAMATLGSIEFDGAGTWDDQGIQCQAQCCKQLTSYDYEATAKCGR